MEVSKEQKIMQQVMSEAWFNPVFKKELIAAPQEAIERLTGEKVILPPGKTLQVFDQSNPDIICLNIPPVPNLDDFELSDKDLELVAGGLIPSDIMEDYFPPTLPSAFRTML